MRLFNALNGSEVKAIILREIGDQLDLDEQFAKHITFPLIEWEWKLTVKAHAQENGEFSAEGGGAVKVRQVEPVAIVLSGGRCVTKSEEHPEGEAPDEARRDAGLPVQTIQDSPLGMVEVPETPMETATNAIDAALQRRKERRSSVPATTPEKVA